MTSDILESDSDFARPNEELEHDETSEEDSRKPTSGPLKYKCPHDGCQERFKRNTYLDRHVYNSHTKIRKYACSMDGCDKRYIIVTHLKRHIKTFHEKIHEPHVKRIKCTVPECVRYFNTQTNLNRHIRQYHDNPKTYDCPKCEFTSRHKLQYTKHQESHNNQEKTPKVNTKSYGCETCAQEFTKWSDLQNHRKLVHPPKCNICDRTFKQRKNLKVHLADHLKKAENTKFPCPHEGCHRSYSHKRNLTAHIETAHEGLRFECPVEGCGKMFTSRRRLSGHVELHSKDDIVVERKPQAERKDKGVKRISTTAILSGLAFGKEANALILAGKSKDLELDYSSFVSTSDSDGEEVRVPRRIHVVEPKNSQLVS